MKKTYILLCDKDIRFKETYKITKRFYIDHVERDLPAPDIIRETKRHLYIDATENEKMKELRADAEFYAEPNVDGCWELVYSARALLKVIGRN